MSPKTLILAPWGDPTKWGPVRYLLRYKDREEEVSSRTSLEVVARVFKDSYILIVVVDTLAVEFLKDFKDYTELKEGVIEGVKEYIASKLEAEALASKLKDEVLEVELVPGIGEFKGWRFGHTERVNERRRTPSPIESYEAEVLATVFNKIVHIDPDEVVVDLTHGINYMPATFYEAVKFAVEAYSVYSNKEVKLIYLNSEPYSKDVSLLNVHVVIEETFHPKNSLERLASWIDSYARTEGDVQLNIASVTLRDGARDLGVSLSEAKETFSKVYQNGLKAARIVLFTMPLALLYFAKQISKDNRLVKVFNEVERVRRLRDRKTIIKGKNVCIPLLFSLDRTKALIYSTSLLSYLRNIVSEVSKASDINLNRVKESGASLEVLRALSEHLGKTYRAIAEHEIHSLRAGCLERAPGIPCVIEVSVRRWPERECEASSADPRNIKAHAGLERNMVEGLREDSTLYIRYRLGKKDCWSVLEDLLKSPNF